MCGIAGVWRRVDETLVARMVRNVAHRGPDGVALVLTHGSSLGAARLAITGDRCASAVFRDPDSQVIVLFNGEIYNHKDLRAELASCGYGFRTDLESETIAKLYAHFGFEFPSRLKGMFAIVVLDGDMMLMARDRFGIKPLYYAAVGQEIAFGSEIKAVLAHPAVLPKLQLSSIEETAIFGYVCSSSHTLFEGISQVEPGSSIRFHGGSKTKSAFWKAPSAYNSGETGPDSFSMAAAQLREKVIQTVHLLFSHGDHSAGIYLSGGLDSSILAVVARCILGHRVTTFTLADNPQNPDLLAARKVAEVINSQHVERLVTEQDYLQGLDHFVRHFESLVAGGVFDIHGGVAFHLLSETVAQYVKVAYSGEGADELFGGYYWAYTHPLGFADRIRARAQSTDCGPDVRNAVDRLFPLPEDEVLYRRNLFDFLIAGGLANYHLQSVDRSAGAFGFEVRPAYLFDDLAEFALQMPIEYKIPDKKTTKRILREAFRPEFERLGLDWVLTRLKDGMPAAVSNIAPLVIRRMEASVTDARLSSHPMKAYLKTKMDVFLFDKFADEFLSKEACVV